MNTESPAQSVRDAGLNPAPTELTITIGTQQFTVSRLPLGALRKVVPAFTRLARCFEGGEIDDEAFADGFTVLAIGDRQACGRASRDARHLRADHGRGGSHRRRVRLEASGTGTRVEAGRCRGIRGLDPARC